MKPALKDPTDYKQSRQQQTQDKGGDSQHGPGRAQNAQTKELVRLFTTNMFKADLFKADLLLKHLAKDLARNLADNFAMDLTKNKSMGKAAPKTTFLKYLIHPPATKSVKYSLA